MLQSCFAPAVLILYLYRYVYVYTPPLLLLFYYLSCSIPPPPPHTHTHMHYSCCTPALPIIYITYIIYIIGIYPCLESCRTKAFHIKALQGFTKAPDTRVWRASWTKSFPSKALLRHLALVFTGVAGLKPFYEGSMKALDKTEAYHSTD